MNNESFNRPPRLRPRWQAVEVPLPASPAAADSHSPQNLLSAALPLLAGLLMLVAARENPAMLRMMLPLQLVTALSSVMLIVDELRRRRQQRQQHQAVQHQFAQRRNAALRTLQRLHDEERAGRQYLDPPPHELSAIVGAGSVPRAPSARLWERRRGDDDFLTVRVGSGTITAAAQPVGGSDDDAVQRRWTLSEQPICLPLPELGAIGIAGPTQPVRELVSAVLAQLMVWHTAADLQIALFSSAEQATDWDWWPLAPHSRSELHISDAPPLLAVDRAGAEWLAAWLLERLSRRRELPVEQRRPQTHLVVICDGPHHLDDLPALAEVARHGPAQAMSVIVLCDDWAAIPADCTTLIETDGLSARWTCAGQPWPTEPFRPDALRSADLHRLTTRLAALRLRDTGSGTRIPAHVTLNELLPPTAAADQLCWPPTPSSAWHPDVPIGALAEGRPLLFNLNEQRHGPHGIIAGATGAGKSVLLQTIIAALALTHDPQRLNLLLIDFKGGAALAPFSALPHCSGLITDLEPALSERVLIAISAELRRRKQLLRDAGTAGGKHIEHIGDYRRCADEHGLASLANLLIVLDEFDELARNQPEFVSALVRVVKQGRSLGVHLLIASQQPSRVVSDEIRSQLSYFLALRLGSSEDSRDMLLRPDAAFLPPELPGRAYLRSGNDLRLFQVAQLTPSLNAVVAQITCRPAVAAPTIWQPPLPAQLQLSAEQRRSSGSCVIAGLIDRPDECRYTPLPIDIQTGHLLVVGAAQSGKSSLLTLILGELCGRLSADSLWCYIVDADGRLPAGLQALPQVGAVLRPFERERMQALLALLERELDRRRRRRGPAPLIVLAIDGLAAWRDEQRDDLLEQQSETLLRLARRGHDAQFRLVICAERSSDLPYRLTALLPQRLALRLNDPAEYLDLLGGRPPLPPTLPGNACWRDGDQLVRCQLALPGELPTAPPSTARAPAPAVPAERVGSAALPPVTLDGQRLLIPIGLSHDPPGPLSITLDSLNPHLLISGARRSGKSSLLQLIARRLAGTHPPTALALLDGPRRRLAALAVLPAVQHYITDDDGAARLAADLARRNTSPTPAPLVILIDDYPLTRERLRTQLGGSYPAEQSLAARLAELVSGNTNRCHLILAGTITFCDDALLRALDGARHGLLLWPHRFERGTRLLDTALPLPHHGEQEPPPGRALLVTDDEPLVVQIAEPPTDLREPHFL